eukprot:TRINITY_DN10861_c0_g1_i1.p1 TRINITY_DN10861_c0_g1~~TRINITY_DN10861_c0_g1_i1.p1  ORF type:complete len:607 (+),score=128.14 TRINITY_DN10861_c0_g1_i1:149-1969(+)
MSTFAHQDELPNLPVAPLELSLANYIQSVTPLLTPADLAKTKEAVIASFKENSKGREYHQRLVDKSAAERNWLEEWWENFAYLLWREPVVVYTNYFCPITDSVPLVGAKSQTHTAAIITRVMLNYKELIDSAKLKVETVGPNKLCMNQYKYIFGVTRIPGEQIDTHRVSTDSKHIAVFCNHHVFSMDVYHRETGALLSVAELDHQLEKIKARADALGLFPHNVSSLTANYRDRWAVGRDHLIQHHSDNASSLEAIETALFTLTLDDATSNTRTELAELLFHGKPKVDDRWYDKGLSLVAFADKKIGLNCEHSPCDAMVVVRMLMYTRDEFKRMHEQNDYGPPLSPKVAQSLPAANYLPFHVNDTISADIADAQETLTKLAARVQLEVFRYKGYGKDFCKRVRFHPDILVQMTLQLAYYKWYGEACATYETGHTRAFYHGRTETIRSCSVESKRWTETMTNKAASNEDRWTALSTALEAHKSYIGKAMTGNAFDRHLLGVKILSILEGEKLPIFEDKGWAINNGFKLSTSNVGYSHVWGGYGPAVDDGYGCCYTIQPDTITVAVSSWRDCKETDSIKFTRYLEESFREIGELCQWNMDRQGGCKSKL